MVQIVKNKTYKYGHTIRVTVCFYQKTTRHWFLIKLRKLLGLEWSLENVMMVFQNFSNRIYSC